ncbi:MAG: hypothetical protein JO235_22380 [Chroococcidiopsidaceae cyanobacterium CP_BM_RX_35]|nr:hypothetical protein [Chroococcidiopsidaceae cyanobacterium CP_BM_RX_35]
MSLKTLTLSALLVATGLVAPVKAQQPLTGPPPTREQVADACIHNHADTLPVPFSDVSLSRGRGAGGKKRQGK